MSAAWAETLHCRVRVSGAMLALNRWVHAGLLVVVLVLSAQRPALLLLLCLPASSYYLGRRAIRLCHNRSITALRWTTDDHWIWQRRDGREVRGRLLHAIVLNHYAVWLRLRPEHRRVGSTAVWLAADSLAPDVHRRLRVRLTLWQPEHAEPHGVDAFQQRLSNLWATVRRRR